MTTQAGWRDVKEEDAAELLAVFWGIVINQGVRGFHQCLSEEAAGVAELCLVEDHYTI